MLKGFLNSIIITLFITGCAGKYKIPDSADTAEITFAHTVAARESITTIKTFDNEKCLQNDFSAQLAKIGQHYTTSSRKETVAVIAGKQIFLASHLWKQEGHPNQGYRNVNCSSLVSFIPEKDKKYIFRAKFINNNRCEVEVTEKKSQLPPMDLSTHKPSEACKKSGKFDFFDV